MPTAMEWVQLVSGRDGTAPILGLKTCRRGGPPQKAVPRNPPTPNKSLGFLSWVPYGLATVSLTNKIIPTNPATSTAVSYPTDT